MTESTLAYANPRILRWIRENSGLSLEEAAKSVTSPANLQKIEDGKKYLTFRQLLLLAHKYHRPPAFFYQEKPPDEQPGLTDFRTLPGTSAKSKLILQQKLSFIREKQEFAVNYKSYDQDHDYSFIGSITLDEDPEVVAEKIRDFLGVVYEKKDKYVVLKEWINAIVSKGVLVFQLTDIDVKDMRGVVINSIPYPTIAINRKDSPHARIFTLLHELCHLMLNSDAICVWDQEDEQHLKPEQFCNLVAGAVLVPKNMLEKHDIIFKHGSSTRWNKEELSTLSKDFQASQEVILRRLLICGFTNHEFYEEMRKIWISSVAKKSKSEEQAGGEPIFKKVLGTNPPVFIRMVLNAASDGEITLSDVSYYLNMKLKHLNLLENALG